MKDTDRSHISATCVIFHSDLFQKRYHKNRTLSSFKFVRQCVEEESRRTSCWASDQVAARRFYRSILYRTD